MWPLGRVKPNPPPVQGSTQGKETQNYTAGLQRLPCRGDKVWLALQVGRQQGQADQEGGSGLQFQLVQHSEWQQHRECKCLLQQGDGGRAVSLRGVHS